MAERKQGTMDRRDVVAAMIKERGDALIVTGLGSTCYDFGTQDHLNTFYLWGGMGAAAMLGLGLALAQPTRRVVAVTGEIDLFTAPEFKQRVSAPIDVGRTHVIVDLTETTFIDSSSLGVLIGAHRRLRRLEGSLVIVCSNDAIVKTFRITGLDSVFTIVTTLDEAFNGDAVGA